jgi:hypothetical protein
MWSFQSPRGDFGFLKVITADIDIQSDAFQSPRGDFGFLKASSVLSSRDPLAALGFNPLAGILVF